MAHSLFTVGSSTHWPFPQVALCNVTCWPFHGMILLTAGLLTMWLSPQRTLSQAGLLNIDAPSQSGPLPSLPILKVAMPQLALSQNGLIHSEPSYIQSDPFQAGPFTEWPSTGSFTMWRPFPQLAFLNSCPLLRGPFHNVVLFTAGPGRRWPFLAFPSWLALSQNV